jgi:nitric oxide reductase subunit B
MQTELMQTLRWMRLFGDTIFAIGAVACVWFALKLMLTKGDHISAAVIEE